MAKRARKNGNGNGQDTQVDLVANAGGSNGDGIPDAATIQFLVGQTDKINAEKKDVAKRAGALRKRITAAGLMISELNRTLKERDERDGEAAFKRARQHLAISEALRLPIARQMQLFPNPLDKGLSHDQRLRLAEQHGSELALMGRDADDQAYPPNTEEGQRHKKGWNYGQQALGIRLMQDKERTKAEEKAKAKTKRKKKDRMSEEEAGKIAEQAVANAVKTERQQRAATKD